PYAGPPALPATDEAGQALNFLVTNDNNNLFSVQPAVAADGTLTYTLKPNANGSATVTVRLHDDGGVANGGVDTSPAQTFTINVTAVNDAPSFTKGGDRVVPENAPAQAVPGWATRISADQNVPTNPNEAGQVLNFLVTDSNTALFSVQPAVAAD